MAEEQHDDADRTQLPEDDVSVTAVDFFTQLTQEESQGEET